MADAPIRQLIYLSVAANGSARLHAADIERVAAPRNAARRVTGFLVADDETFMQLIEGPPSVIADLYARIERDPRHTELLVIYDTESEERLLPDWDMRLIDPENDELHLAGLGVSERRLIDALLARCREHDAVPPAFREHLDGVRELMASGIF
jgi:hypothetical protein